MTGLQETTLDKVIISIHMPHTWHDTTANQYIVEHYDFNPHATYVA